MSEKIKKLHPHIEKIYVKVSSDFDATGYMRPKSITWNDGRVFTIDSVQDFRPAEFSECGVTVHNKNNSSNTFGGDCYTIVIQGEVRHLFFEHTNPRFADRAGRCGRWYVEQTVV